MLTSLSWLVTMLGVCVFVVTLIRRPAAVPEAVALLLEFLLAAGLLRLDRQASFLALAGVAGVVVLRKLATAGLRFGR